MGQDIGGPLRTGPAAPLPHARGGPGGPRSRKNESCGKFAETNYGAIGFGIRRIFAKLWPI